MQVWGYAYHGGQGWLHILHAAHEGKQSQLAYSIVYFSLWAKLRQGWIPKIWKSSYRDASATRHTAKGATLPKAWHFQKRQNTVQQYISKHYKEILASSKESQL